MFWLVGLYVTRVLRGFPVGPLHTVRFVPGQFAALWCLVLDRFVSVGSENPCALSFLTDAVAAAVWLLLLRP